MVQQEVARVENEFSAIPEGRRTQCQHCLVENLKRLEKGYHSSSAEGAKRVQGSAGLRVKEREN